MRRTLPVLAACVVAATGCGFHGVYSLPLPGAVANSGRTVDVKVQFADVLDLVPYSAVKVNGATVGHVQTIAVQGRHALVDCRIRASVRLPANAVARVEQTSVLGEKFVEIEPPAGVPAVGRLADGGLIPLGRTDTDASVEEVLGALSMLLTGGGVDQLHTITHELGQALQGRAGVARDLLQRLGVFAAGLDAQKHELVSAIDGLNRLAATVRGQESELVAALRAMPSALNVLADDRRQLTTMLTAVRHLGDVATGVVRSARADLLANLRDLRPTLDKLAEVGDVIPKTLGVLLTYPTADSVEQEYFGDYGNLTLTIDVSAASLLATFAPKAGAAPVPARPSNGASSVPPTPVTPAPTPSSISDLLMRALT
jgi:phospholipid/cholesterol/gamma-HCH transport system substrate-binding protein